MTRPAAAVSARDLWKCLPRLFFRHQSLPLELVYFVTHRCVASCDHCFDWKRRLAVTKNAELSLDEIEKVSRSMDRLALLFLTGGEAFVRDDLSEIARIFYKNNSVFKLQIPSNGWFTDKTVQAVDTLARTCPSMHSSVSVSIDAIGEAHDRLRGLKGLFERACATIKELQVLAKLHPNIGVNVNLTLSTGNEDTAVETFRYLHQVLRVQNVFLLLVRGEPRSGAAAGPAIDKYQRLRAEVEAHALSDRHFGYYGFDFADLITHKDLLKYRTVEKVVRTGKSYVDCAAGTLYGVMYANGDVSFCEMRDFGLGNVRANEYDFKRLWLSAHAQAEKRSVVATGCTCTHECAIAASLLTRPSTLCRILLSKAKRDLGLGTLKSSR
jgi:AdoMet-dependent heme synthase